MDVFNWLLQYSPFNPHSDQEINEENLQATETWYRSQLPVIAHSLPQLLQ